MGDKLHYWPVALLVRLIGALPRPLARGVGIVIGVLVTRSSAPASRRFTQSGAGLPGESLAERRKILRGVYISLGRLLGETCLFSRYTTRNASQVAVYQGFENFEAARSAAKGCCC